LAAQQRSGLHLPCLTSVKISAKSVFQIKLEPTLWGLVNRPCCCPKLLPEGYGCRELHFIRLFRLIAVCRGIGGKGREGPYKEVGLSA
jgi:hypothetical protein